MFFSRKRAAVIVAVALLCVSMMVVLGCSTASVTYERPMPIQVQIPLSQQLEKNKAYLKADRPYTTVGKCVDETGKYNDAHTLRYSKAMTQGPGKILENLLVGAIGYVVDRDPYNLSLIANEYKMTNNLKLVPATDKEGHVIHKRDQNGKIVLDNEGKPIPEQAWKNIGLVQKGGPQQGLQGFEYVVSCSIVTFAVDHLTGGVGVEIDAMGVNVQTAVNRIGTVYTLTNSRGEVVDSVYMLNKTVATRYRADITRYWGGGRHYVQSEVGFADQLPTDYAFYDNMTAGVARLLERNWELFYNKKPIFNFGKEFDGPPPEEKKEEKKVQIETITDSRG